MRQLLSLLPVLGLALVGCAVEPEGPVSPDDEAAMDADLTSVSALSRKLTFQGVVHVRDGATDSEILSVVRKQTQSAFGALRTANVGVNSRELKDVDPATFVKTKVQVVDGTTVTTMLRVQYTYTDNAVAPKSMARRTSLSLALLGKDYSSQSARILTECTDNDAEARDFASSLWYVFNPSLSGCKTAIAAERKKIAADRAKLAAGQIPKSEVDRLYLPITVRLGADQTNKGNSYPEYDRLYSGGVKKDTLVISLVNGILDHEHKELADDSGYSEWMETLREVFAVRPGLQLAAIEPAEDFKSVTVGGKTYSNIAFTDVMKWTIDGTGFPAGMPTTLRHDAQVAMAKKLSRHWLTFRAPLQVKIGANAVKTVTLELTTYFGAESDPAPHKRAIKNSDVFVYNGHSYIGYGPLDPSRFSASDFPSSYQILFIDGCVSYNYYEKDYLPLKPGATRNLELITNGLEAPSWRSGWALGRFLGKLVDGSQASYRDLLSAASATDSLRVVDGEVDNLYSPTKTPITVK
ncbi:MAG: hypothetical protein JNL79_05550 [Myxococcales bacterium]|nr:hypothetical protein [Myxococcales bacterium]